MSLKIPNIGLQAELDNTLAVGTYTIHLFKNNITPAAGDTLATYTEADFNGYASQNIVGWSPAAIVSGRASSTAAANVWTKAAGGTGNSIYGYFVKNPAGGLAWAERDGSAPRDMSTDGNQLAVIPARTLKSEF